MDDLDQLRGRPRNRRESILTMISSTVPETRRDEKKKASPPPVKITKNSNHSLHRVSNHLPQFPLSGYPREREVGEGADFIRKPGGLEPGIHLRPRIGRRKKKKGRRRKEGREKSLLACLIRATRFNTHAPFNRSQFNLQMVVLRHPGD